MALPAGATAIPRRSVAYTTVQPSFPLIGRTGVDAAGDLANPGNSWRADIKAGQRQARTMNAMFDAGNLMGVVVGNDVRNWVQMLDNFSVGNNDREALRPNSIYFSTRSASTDYIIVATAPAFRPGDRVTFLQLGTGQVDVYISGRWASGAFTRVRLKSGGGAKIGASVTFEWGYLDAVTPTLGLVMVATNGAVGTLVDGNPIGVG